MREGSRESSPRNCLPAAESIIDTLCISHAPCSFSTALDAHIHFAKLSTLGIRLYHRLTSCSEGHKCRSGGKLTSMLPSVFNERSSRVLRALWLWPPEQNQTSPFMLFSRACESVPKVDKQGFREKEAKGFASWEKW